jgi:hypothetical protein
MPIEYPDEKQHYPYKGTFALPSSDLEELLDFIEDMIMMAGCPYCDSLNTKVIETDLGRILLCLDCGHQEMLPPPN